MSPLRVSEAEVRVRYAETDALGVAYYASHLIWFEVGRVTLLRDLGLDFAAAERDEISFVVAEATCHYHAPAHFDERLVVRTWIDRLSARSFVTAYEIMSWDAGETIATGRTTQVFVDKKSHKPVTIPPQARTLLERALSVEVAEQQHSTG